MRRRTLINGNSNSLIKHLFLLFLVQLESGIKVLCIIIESVALYYALQSAPNAIYTYIQTI
jgi:hypothetical protein